MAFVDHSRYCRFCRCRLSDGTTHDELVDNLVKNEILTHELATNAFRDVDRGHFIDQAYKDQAYGDHAVFMGHGAQVSAPHLHGTALNALASAFESHGRDKVRVLDIGSGSGYFMAVLARCMGLDVNSSQEDYERLVGVEYDFCFSNSLKF